MFNFEQANLTAPNICYYVNKTVPEVIYLTTQKFLNEIVI